MLLELVALKENRQAEMLQVEQTIRRVRGSENYSTGNRAPVVDREIVSHMYLMHADEPDTKLENPKPSPSKSTEADALSVALAVSLKSRITIWMVLALASNV